MLFSFMMTFVTWFSMGKARGGVRRGRGGVGVWGNFQIASSNSITRLILNALFWERGALPHAKKNKDKMPCKAYTVLIFFKWYHTYGGFIHAIYNLLFLHPHLMFQITTIEFWGLNWSGPTIWVPIPPLESQKKIHESEQEGGAMTHSQIKKPYLSEQGNDRFQNDLSF